MKPDVVRRLKDVAGPQGFSDDPASIAPYLEEWRSKYQGRSSLLLKPATTDEVARILAICDETDTPIVPQGGNTGLVGGQIPFDGEVLLSLRRLNRIRSLDRGTSALIAEAGVVLAEAQRAAEGGGLYFPLSLAAEGSCTIGGTIATNAGGVNVLRYGMMRSLVLGLEVVLASGRVLDLLKTVRKDNSGYDLKHLFIGTEGTLGIITAAALRLFPKTEESITTFVAVPSPAAAIVLLAQMQSATSDLISAFELVSRFSLELVMAHFAGTRDPLPAPSPWYVLFEATTSSTIELKKSFEDALSAAVASSLVTDAVVAANETQRARLWALRENISEAQKRDGASLKHDISVPIAAIPGFIDRATAEVLKLVPGARPVTFGHVGDGNIHFNFTIAKDGEPAPFLAKWDVVQRTVHDIVQTCGGSFSAEHGIGVMKRADLSRYKSTGEIDLMRALKRTLDPKGILNPGKVVPDES
jgi:FAD/FMN-containing dehydrogenase